MVAAVPSACAAEAKAPIGQHPQKLDREITENGVTKRVGCGYLLSLPEQYYESSKRWPVILFLHGAGGSGNDLKRIVRGGIPKIAGKLKSLPFIGVSPQCPRGDRWSSDRQAQVLNALLDEIIEKYRVDEGRIYLTGLSLGGAGTWNFAVRRPDRLAAIAPVCGWARPANADKIKHIPVWAFHGAKDHKVPVEQSIEMVNALKRAGGDARLTIHPISLPELTIHNSWTQTYSNPELYEWFLKHRGQQDGRIVTEELPPAEGDDAEAWAKLLPKFRRELFMAFRQDLGFADVKGFDPADGIRFSLPIRNPFSEDLSVRFEWHLPKGQPWQVTSDPVEAVVRPGEAKRIQFVAGFKGQGRLFPRPSCTMHYSAGEFSGEIPIPLPMDINAYLQKHRPTLTARRAAVVPNIDGRLDEPIWQGKADAIGFERPKLDSVPSVRTEGYFAYDDAYCYVALRCHEPFVAKLNIGSDGRNGDLKAGDFVEIVLDTDAERRSARYYYLGRRKRLPQRSKTFYHFVVDPSGAVQATREKDRSFSAAVKAKAVKGKAAWTVEVAIPWADLNIAPPIKGKQMGLLLVRTRYPKTEKTLTDTGIRKISPEVLHYPPLNGDMEDRKQNFGNLAFEQ